MYRYLTAQLQQMLKSNMFVTITGKSIRNENGIYTYITIVVKCLSH